MKLNKFYVEKIETFSIARGRMSCAPSSSSPKKNSQALLAIFNCLQYGKECLFKLSPFSSIQSIPQQSVDDFALLLVVQFAGISRKQRGDFAQVEIRFFSFPQKEIRGGVERGGDVRQRLHGRIALPADVAAHRHFRHVHKFRELLLSKPAPLHKILNLLS